jgi:hypothetical protein
MAVKTDAVTFWYHEEKIQNVPPKHWYPMTRQHCFMTQKTKILTSVAISEVPVEENFWFKRYLRQHVCLSCFGSTYLSTD